MQSEAICKIEEAGIVEYFIRKEKLKYESAPAAGHKCPQCKHQQMVMLWQSLNVTVSSTAKADLLAGKINTFECESCGLHAALAVPFAYHDMRLKIYVHFQPFELVDENFLKSYNRDGSYNMEKFKSSSLPIPEYMQRPHIVFSMSELVRYVLFREKLAAQQK